MRKNPGAGRGRGGEMKNSLYLSNFGYLRENKYLLNNLGYCFHSEVLLIVGKGNSKTQLCFSLIIFSFLFRRGL